MAAVGMPQKLNRFVFVRISKDAEGSFRGLPRDLTAICAVALVCPA